MHDADSRPDYVSEFEAFIDAFMRQHPETERKQREARAMWWDKPPLTIEEIDRTVNPEVKPKPYEYD